MALLHRFSRLLSADLHAVLDRLEDPQVLLQQAQREMTGALTDQRAQLATLEQSLTMLERQQQQGTSRLKDLAGELDLCLDNDNEPLARSVIKRRLRLEAELESLQNEMQTRGQQRIALAAAIERQQADLETVTVEAERLAERNRYQSSRCATAADPGAVISEEAVELALLAERRARGGSA